MLPASPRRASSTRNRDAPVNTSTPNPQRTKKKRSVSVDLDEARANLDLNGAFGINLSREENANELAKEILIENLRRFFVGFATSRRTDAEKQAIDHVPMAILSGELQQRKLMGAAARVRGVSDVRNALRRGVELQRRAEEACNAGEATELTLHRAASTTAINHTSCPH